MRVYDRDMAVCVYLCAHRDACVIAFSPSVVYPSLQAVLAMTGSLIDSL